MFIPSEIIETIRMIQEENLDIRTITMGISLRDCISRDPKEAQRRMYEKITGYGKDLVSTAGRIEKEYGIPIVNTRISVTPISLIAESAETEDYLGFAKALDRAAGEIGIDFLGGFSALVHKGYTPGDRKLTASIPEALSATKKVCSSVNIATTRAGINMDAVREMGRIILDTGGIGCAKLVVFANVPEDNPFMAGAFHGVGEPDCVVNVGISGPGVIYNALRKVGDVDFEMVSETIKKSAFKITRMGQLVAREASKRLGVSFGIVDLSLAPTPARGDSVARILEEMGLEKCGAHGTTAALALLNDAVKKGGAMASSYVGGLSGSFIPVSEDEGMIEAVRAGAMSLEKLEAMTSVCSVGLDMIAVPGTTPAETISAIIADEAAIGVINNKTTAVRIIPAEGKKAGDTVEFGGLLGTAPVMECSTLDSSRFIRRSGRIPAPLRGLRN
jgi:hypothetical protein